tara:strand:+ start:219 stop:491 length:273 start_codon:yes stop_codon:yes gene_type:complete
MSIVFLLLVLLISLGFSCCLRVEKEGMEGTDDDNAVIDESKVEVPESEIVEEESNEEEESVADVKPQEQPSTFNVSPMEGSCTETMSNYN